jgi:hypothetical protein
LFLWQFSLTPNSEAGLIAAATPRRNKVQATFSSPVVAAIMPLPETMRRERCYYLMAKDVAATFGWPLRSSGLTRISDSAFHSPSG